MLDWVGCLFLLLVHVRVANLVVSLEKITVHFIVMIAGKIFRF